MKRNVLTLLVSSLMAVLGMALLVWGADQLFGLNTVGTVFKFLVVWAVMALVILLDEKVILPTANKVIDWVNRRLL